MAREIDRPTPTPTSRKHKTQKPNTEYKNLTAGYDFFLFHINSGSDFKVKGEHSDRAVVVVDDDDGSTIFHSRLV